MEKSFYQFYSVPTIKKLIDGINPSARNSRLNEDDDKTVLEFLNVSPDKKVKLSSIQMVNRKISNNSAQQDFVELANELCKDNSSFLELDKKLWFHTESDLERIVNRSKRYGIIRNKFLYKDANVTLLMLRAIKLVLDAKGEEELAQYSFTYEVKDDDSSSNDSPAAEQQYHYVTEEEREDGEKVADINIKDVLNNIKNYIFARGFDYPDGLIENFYLSIKSKPFVILAGTSGTGKTRLVKLFAEAISAEFKLVSVRPDWSDGTDLFGHTDLNGNFIPGPVCSAFDVAISNPKKPVFLCLDEMNLARVEYYLSDFLSVIESREKKNGHIITEQIAQYKNGLPENLYVIGTVNMDETTFPFSKKVLDRANTIEFNFVDLIPKQRTGDSFEPQDLPNSFLCTSYLILAAEYAKDQEFIDTICTELQTLNGKLAKANSHIGFRVRDEIVFYMLNNKEAGGLLDFDEALDNEIMQKILPRIQGSSAAIKSLLIDIFKFCMKNESGIDADTGNVGEQMSRVAVNARYPESAKKVSYMMKRFENDGFTSYWL